MQLGCPDRRTVANVTEYCFPEAPARWGIISAACNPRSAIHIGYPRRYSEIFTTRAIPHKSKQIARQAQRSCEAGTSVPQDRSSEFCVLIFSCRRCTDSVRLSRPA
jgi:hypothetical protein